MTSIVKLCLKNPDLVLKREENKFFREVTVAWAQAYGQGDSLVSLQQVQCWPCGYSPSIQSRSLLGVPCHCSFTQPNTCIRSLAATAAGIPLSHGWPVPGAASLWHTLLVRKVFHSKLTAWKIWRPKKSSRVETERGWIICPLDRCSEDGSSHQYLAFFCGCWGSSPYYEPPCQVSRSCIHDYVETTVMLHSNHRRDNNVDVFELTAYNY